MLLSGHSTLGALPLLIVAAIALAMVVMPVAVVVVAGGRLRAGRPAKWRAVGGHSLHRGRLGRARREPIDEARRAVRAGTVATLVPPLRTQLARAEVHTDDAITARLHLALAYALAAQGQFVEATEHYDDALRGDAALFGTCVELAQECILAGRDDAAEAALVTALAWHGATPSAVPTRGRACYLYGQLLVRLGRVEEAAYQLSQAVTLCPDAASARETFGQVLEALGRDEEALAQYRTGVHLAPQTASLHRQLGSLLLRLGDLDAAGACLRTAAALAPDDALAHLCLAQRALSLGEWHEAEREADAAVALDASSVEAHLALGAALLRLGDTWRAEISARRALDLVPLHAGAFALLGFILRERGQHIEALLHLRQALLLDAGLPEALWRQADRLDALGFIVAAHARRQEAAWIAQADLAL